MSISVDLLPNCVRRPDPTAGNQYSLSLATGWPWKFLGGLLHVV